MAIDADPQMIAAAGQNLTRNGFSHQMRFFSAFLGDSDEDAECLTFRTRPANSRLLMRLRSLFKENVSRRVRSISLDRIVQETGLVPDLVKIDVEGAEARALSGGRGLAGHHRTRFLVEMHSCEELPMFQNGERVLSWCQQVGFSAYYLKEHKLVTVPDAFSHRGRCHLLLQPREWEYPPFLRKIEQGDCIEKTRIMLGKYENSKPQAKN